MVRDDVIMKGAAEYNSGPGDDNDTAFSGAPRQQRTRGANEGDALITVGGNTTRRTGTGKKGKKASWNDIVASIAILTVAAALVIYSWTMQRHTQGNVDWNDASAYPFQALKLKQYDTADVINTARSGRWYRGATVDRLREQYEAQPDSWLADPTDLTVFGWEDGIFTLNFLHATSEELGGITATPKVSARMLELWRKHDYDALAELGGFAHERVYVTFIALVYTAMAYMPQRFKLGQPPFHVVTHQRDYLALKCAKDVPRGSKFNPCPASKDYAPILNFGTGLKSAEVFPSAVTMPHPEFIDAVLKNTPAVADGEEENPLGLDEDHLDLVVHASDALIGWNERMSLVTWRGGDVPFVPGMPFGSDRVDDGDTCQALLTDVLKMSEKDADAYVGGSKAAEVQPPRKVTLDDIAAWMATAAGAGAAKTMTPRWRAVIMSAVTRQAAQAAAAAQSSSSLGAAGTAAAGTAARGMVGGGTAAGGGAAEKEAEEALGALPRAVYEAAAATLGVTGDAAGGVTGEWLDAKFTRLANGKCAGVLPEELVGELRNHAQRQHYKYTLDVGGHGGTSWLGTLTAMSTASLVFRVDSPMADFYDAELKPWVHYVPVASDLSNLPERYLWAQNNQANAREIAAAGAVYARDMSAEKMWASYASLPLGEARKAYHVVGPATAEVTDEYRKLVRDLVPIYTYDATEETGDKTHTGVLLPDGEKVRNLKQKKNAA
jgi:hypothetical protein